MIILVFDLIAHGNFIMQHMNHTYEFKLNFSISQNCSTACKWRQGSYFS